MNKDYAIQILPYISELGRWDYVFEGIGTEIEENVYELIRAYLMIDIKNYNDNKPVSLLAKWLPSIKTHNKKNYFAVKLAKKLNLTEKEYRKILSKLRDSLNIVEKHITNKEYEKIEYISVPSKAMVKYKNLFFLKFLVFFRKNSFYHLPNKKLLKRTYLNNKSLLTRHFLNIVQGVISPTTLRLLKMFICCQCL